MIPANAPRRWTTEGDATRRAPVAVTFPTHRLHIICISSNAYACSGASAGEAVVAIGLFGEPSG